MPNRTLLRDRLQQAILVAERDDAALALLIMDLDRFKDVNDTLGHHTGDELLQQVGLRLRGALRASDTVARMGGDEFGVVLPLAADADARGARRADAGEDAGAARSRWHGQLVRSAPASALRCIPSTARDVETLLRHADVAMYGAKRAGQRPCRLLVASTTRTTLSA